MAAHANTVHPWNPEFVRQERREPMAFAYYGDLSRMGFVAYRRVRADQPVVETLFLSGVSIILRRDVIAEIGGYVFDPDMFLYGEDMDLALRIRTAGYRTVVATRATVYHAHVLQDRLSLSSFVKTVRIIRNRLLAWWKSSDGLEFVALAAITLAGAPFNSTQFGLPAAKKVAHFFLLVPPTLVAGVAAIASMPAYAARRRQSLALRRVNRGWLLRTLAFERSNLSHRPVRSRPQRS
jgi:GT2 family glycosyltransferase